MQTLVLSSSLYRQIEEEGVRAYPNECCGVMIGRDEKGADGSVRRVVDRLMPLTNSFEKEEQYHRFKQLLKDYPDPINMGYSYLIPLKVVKPLVFQLNTSDVVPSARAKYSVAGCWPNGNESGFG